MFCLKFANSGGSEDLLGERKHLQMFSILGLDRVPGVLIEPSIESERFGNDESALAASLHYPDSYFCAICPDLRNVHRVTQHGQRMKRARTLSPHFITNLPDTFRQMIDE
jgi:hypothetical protein